MLDDVYLWMVERLEDKEEVSHGFDGLLYTFARVPIAPFQFTLCGRKASPLTRIKSVVFDVNNCRMAIYLNGVEVV